MPKLAAWPCLLIALAGVWTIATYFGRSAAGVTASDPYAYAQMATDLVERGTLLHAFPLSHLAQELELPRWPTVHVGYHVPPADRTEAASVWAPGTSVLLALGYWLGGERGLFWTVPLLGLLAAGMAGVLAWELYAGWSRAARLWLAAITAAILATSYRQVELAVTPMSDVPAQLLALAALWAAVRAARRSSWRWGLLAGAALGISCSIRYTHLLLLIPVLVAAAAFRPRDQGLGAALRWLAPAGLATAVLYLPLLRYHQVAFGAPFTPASSGEAAYFALANVLPVAGAVAAELLRTNEFFYLLPWVVLGAWATWREERPAFFLLAAWILGLTLLQLPYAALRLRGLLSILPALAALAACGIVAWSRYWLRSWRRCSSRKVRWAAAVAIAIPAACFLLRTRVTLQLPLGAEFHTFGYLNAAERQAFGAMAAFVPPAGVVASSLNSGAVDLYAGRAAVRPAYWTRAEFNVFLAALQAADRPLYLLADGDEMEQPLAWARQAGELTPVWQARLPFFTPNGSSSPQVVTLWQLIMPAN